MSAGIKPALVETYEDVLRNHTLQMAAALSYYFVLSIFPVSVIKTSRMHEMKDLGTEHCRGVR